MNDLHTYTNLAAVVRAHAEHNPERVAFTFLSYRGRSHVAKQESITIAELDQRARAIAATLQQHSQVGDRALLLFRPGLDFISALLGCFYAGVVAVPSSVPRLGVGAARLQAIAKDAEASLALSHSVVKANLDQQHEALQLNWLLTDTIDIDNASAWQQVSLNQQDLALLQYSSGSTGQPKGVMLSHANLLDQSAVIAAQSAPADGSTVVSWLPAFHDMGLVFGILQPLYRAHHGVLMAPESFIQSPIRWLQAISDYRAAYSVAPDFAYELCTRNIAAADLNGLDLACWLHAGNAAEPVRAGTIERFSERFAECGFARKAFLPMYGLAEATLLVAARGTELRITEFDALALEQNRVELASAGAPSRRLVSCGIAVPGSDVRIIDTTNLTPLAEAKVGEIWVAGGSVGLGYFANAAASAEAFVSASGLSERSYLRTGDLGFFFQGELYICGRLKDLILIRGANHHAPDIEASVAAAHPMLSASAGAAFSIDFEEQEKLVVVYELERSAIKLSDEELAKIVATIRQAIAESHSIAVHAVMLLQRGVPKTSSGKVQRLACRAKFLAGEFNARYLWQAATAVQPEEPADTIGTEPQVSAALAERVGNWLPEVYASLLACDADAARVTQSFSLVQPGQEILDQLRRQAEVEFSILLDPLLFQEIDSLAEFAHHICGLMARAEAGLGLPAEELDFQAESRAAAGSEAIAIIGIGCRFPGAADSPAAFWENLKQGLDSVTEVPAERWLVDSVYDENPLANAKMNTRQGGFLKDIELFDRQFFDCSVREAVRMDPAHRLMLEVGWEALEDGGIAPENMSETRTGVFVGISGSDYAHLQFGDESMADAYAGLGSALTNAASRVSHFLNLRGPALAVDTACSSSLSALHIALNSIRAGECEMALAGGVNIVLSPSITMSLCRAGMMAPDGRCKAFDSRANGYVRSEGAGLVLLKPLARALADGNPVYAVIRGSASNHDGRSSALAAPNGAAQQRVVMAACQNAGIQPGQLNYVETHGTGTPVGDPIEANALGEVLRIGAPEAVKCAIGSVKTNIGHTESAAGVAGVIKAALMLKHRTLVPSLHFQEANPKIPFERLRIKVQTELEDISGLPQPALIGVNSFGIGGTNVHVVLEEHRASVTASSATETGKSEQLYMLPVTAKTINALKANAQAMADYLLDPANQASLADICHSQVFHRAQLDQRLVVIGQDRQELIAELEAFASVNQQGEAIRGSVRKLADDKHPLAFVFSGHASHWWAMGRELFATETVYHDRLLECDALLQAHTGWSLVELMHKENGEHLLDDTGYAQPAIFALQVSLAALWQSWGIRPDAIVGHSVGEIAAAHVAGALSLADAARLVATRANIMRQASAGGMASVELDATELGLRLSQYPHLSLAAINGPKTCVVSGEASELEQFLQVLASENITAIKLAVNYAFHSSQMEAYKLQLVDALQGLPTQVPTIPFASTVSGEFLAADKLLDAAYWGDNLREPVAFVAAIESVARAGITSFLEIGPHPVFAGNLVKILNNLGLSASVHASLNRRTSEARTIRAGFASLYAVGKTGDWRGIQAGGQQLTGLPAYRWDKQRYWLDEAHQKARSRLSSYPLLTTRLPLAQPAWESLLDHQTVPYLDAQRIKGRCRFPNGVAIEMALEAGQHLMPDVAFELADLSFAEPLYLNPENPAQTLQTLVQTQDREHHQLRLSADTVKANGNWRAVLQAQVRKAGEVFNGNAVFAIETLKSRSQQLLDASFIYQKFAELGVQYETPLQLINQVWLGEEESLLELKLQARLSSTGGNYRSHPLVFEAIEQAARIASGINAARHILSRVDRLCLLGIAEQAQYIFVRRRANSQAEHSVADLWLIAADGAVLAVVEGLALHAVQHDIGDGFSISADPDQWRYQFSWQAQEVTASAALSGRWLLLADQGGTAQALAKAMRGNGAEVVMAQAGTAYKQLAAQEFQVRPDSIEDLSQLINNVTANGAKACKGILYLWGMDAPLVDTIDDAARQLDQTNTTISLAVLVQALTQAGLGSRPRLWVVTSGAVPVGIQNSIEVAQTGMLGLAKGIALEHPELRCCRVDLSNQSDLTEIAALLNEIQADSADDQVALRGQQRFVARLAPQLTGVAAGAEISVAQAQTEGAPFAVQLTRTESGSNTILIRGQRRAPAEHELEIRVQSVVIPAGMVQAMQYSAQSQILADQHIGRVVRVGPGVSQFQVGDQVIVLQTQAVASHLISQLDRVVRLTSAASIGNLKPYLAASLAMQVLANLSRNSCVFINGADTAQGLAVLQVAKALGAKVFLAASRPEALEQASDWGAIHAFDLSDPSIIDQLRALRGEKGVDVFVNCLPGYDLSRCVAALSPFGRCLDMAACEAGFGGDSSRLRLPGNASLQTVDVESLIQHDPGLLHGLLEDISKRLEQGSYRQLPQQVVELSQFKDNLSSTGATQLLLTLPQPESASIDQARSPFHADASYLITGGLGGLGLALARRMAQRGARHLILAGRSAANLAALDTIAEIEQLGVHCHVAALDVADPLQLSQLLDQVQQQMPPIRGVMHAAGTLDNGLLIQLQAAQFHSVARAKILGGWNLHQQLQAQPLDFFVMFSSLAAAIGSPGQSNYSAANAFLDGLAEHRRAQGLPGLSIGWGPWSEVGMASSVHTLDKLAEHGMGMVPLAAGLNLLEELVAEQRQGAMAVLPMHWARWGESFPLASILPYFSLLVPQGNKSQSSAQARITSEMLQQMSEAAQIEVLQSTVHRAVCQAMRIDGDGLDVNTPLTAAGLDSILALELKSRIEAAIDVVVQTYALLKGQTIRGLAMHFRGLMLAAPAVSAAVAEPETADVEAAGLLDRLDEMSEAEVAALLRELEQDPV